MRSIVLMIEKVQIKDATLYWDDCADVLSQMESADALVTDPPYGIGASSGVGKYGVQKWGGDEDLEWDEAVPDGAMLKALLASAKHHIRGHPIIHGHFKGHTAFIASVLQVG